jgi:catechol 2,3-dioxygenase-like lactoylglutathione lyase family enzyme
MATVELAKGPRRVGNVELPPIDQVGFVVRDLDATMQRYAQLFGPFSVMESSLSGVLYRGVPTDVSMRIAYGSAGELEMEFIEITGGASAHTEFLNAGREGIHHVRYRVPDCAAAIAALAGEGFAPIWQHDMGFAKWAYLEHASRDGVLIEVLEMAGAPTTQEQ